MNAQAYGTAQFGSAPPARASSRKAKYETGRVLRQTVLLVVISVGVVLGFLFVVLPGIIRVVSSHESGAPTQTDQAVVPIQPPVLAAPITATSSADITLTGFSQNGDTVVVLQNGQEAQRATANADGSFSASITLQPGANTVQAYAVDANNKQSDLSAQYSVTYANQPPKLDISTPTDGQQVQGKRNQNLEVKGQTDPMDRITINDRIVFAKDDGSFDTTFLLGQGSNTIDVKAMDQAGNITEKKFTVTYSD